MVQIFLVPPTISGTGKATDFKFDAYIYRAYPNKSPLKFFRKQSVGVSRDCPNFLGTPLLSQQRVKLRTSNFVATFIGSTGTKAYENIGNSGRGCSQGVPKIFRAPICRAHCAVIFAIAQLSCIIIPPEDLWPIFPKRMGIFQPNFTRLLCVPIYARLRSFIQLSATLTKLWYIKRDYPVHITCAKCPPYQPKRIFWHFSQTVRNF